jgi:hypothetical protein
MYKVGEPIKVKNLVNIKKALIIIVENIIIKNKVVFR